MSAVLPAPTIPLSQCLVPITVAITGHRDIPKEDEPKLRSALREQLDSLALKHPSSPRLFLSGLAEGADRLAARCALEAGWQLGAVLPLPQSDYENDFESPESIADTLLVAAHAAMFANANLGGLCLGFKELDCEWDVEDADALIAALPARYQISYRTMAHDLSLIG